MDMYHAKRPQRLSNTFNGVSSLRSAFNQAAAGISYEPDSMHKTPLYYAVRAGNVESAKVLIENPAIGYPPMEAEKPKAEQIVVDTAFAAEVVASAAVKTEQPAQDMLDPAKFEMNFKKFIDIGKGISG